MTHKHPVSIASSETRQRFRISNRVRAWLVASGVALLTIAAFSPLVKAPFLYDDHTVIEGDRVVIEASVREGDISRDISLWRDLWRKPRPLRQLSHRIDWRLVGDNAAYPHAVNILLHLAVAGMGWLLLRRRCGASAAVATGAVLLFLVNPVAVESVGIVSHRKEMLGAFFILLGLFFALRDSSRISAGAVICFLLAAAGKETSLIAPFFFALLAWAGNGGSERQAGANGGMPPRSNRHWIRPFAVYAAFAILFAALFWWQIRAGMDFVGGNPGEQEARAGHFTAGVAWGEAISAAIRAFPRNLLLLLLPFGHAPDPVIALHVPLFSLETLCAMLALGLGLVLLWRFLRGRDPVGIPLLWVFIALAPYLFPGLLRIGATAVLADRYLYFASFGFAWALVLFICRLPRLASRFAFAAFVALYGIVSFTLCLNYLDEADYWAFASRQNPASVLAAHNHAWGLWKEHEDFIGARLEFHRMLRLAPDFDYGICSFAQMHAEENDPESAMNLLDSSLRRRPESMHLNRQRALVGAIFDEGSPRTIRCFRKAAALGADDGTFHFGWAEELFGLLDWRGAAREYRLAGQRDPVFTEEAECAGLLLKDPPPVTDGRILILGDSVPHGTGTKGENDETEKSLADALGSLIFNHSAGRMVDASVPGSSVEDLEEQLEGALEGESAPPFAVCVILTGHNDAFAEAPSFDILVGLANAALECRKRGIIPILVGPISVRDDPGRLRGKQERTLAALDRKLATFCKAAGLSYVSSREALGPNNPAAPSAACYDARSGNHLSRDGMDRLAGAVQIAINRKWMAGWSLGRRQNGFLQTTTSPFGKKSKGDSGR